MIRSFDALPEVALARDVLRRWWGLELGLSAPDGGGYERTSHTGCDTIKAATGGACALELKAIAAEFAKAKTAAQPITRRCHAGLVMVAAPVRGAAGLLGVVYATGGRDAADPADPAHASAPGLDEADLVRVRDLVAGAANAVERVQPVEVPPTTFTHPYTEIVGDAPAVRDVVKLLTKVVKSEATVLIHGESGTGKELIARAIHYHGPRAKKPFVVQNCSAFNDNLLESALFGHVRGSFTGAVKDQPGLFQTADNGTFFLDEIGDMSPSLQVKLLRVLQEGTLTPVGGTKPIKVDVRIIAASHKDLAQMVSQKMFREDLFYRVNVLKITVPPLRERANDIPRLAQHFVAKHWRSHTPSDLGRSGAPAPRLSQGALARLVAYAWPGNIRELENEIERMLVLAGDAPELTASMVSPRVAGSAAIGRPLREILDAAEAAAIVAALGRHIGDRDAAATDLNVSRMHLDARMVALGIASS